MISATAEQMSAKCSDDYGVFAATANIFAQ